MKKNKFISDLIVTTAVSIALTLAGMVFRVYISNNVGAECMGLFQLVYTIYIPACTVAASGINLATVRLISASEARKEQSSQNIMKCCFLYAFIFGTIALLLLMIFSTPASTFLLKTPTAAFNLKILSLGLPFLSAASAVNGYFTAKRKILKTLSIQVSEDIAKIAVTVGTLQLFKESTIDTRCSILVFGSAVGEIISCIVAIIFYISEKKDTNLSAKKGFRHQIKELLSIALPTAISSYIRSGLSALENMLVPFGYKKYGYSNEDSLYYIGVFKGMVFPLMMFPSSLLNAASRLLVPEISNAYEKKDMKKIESIAVKAIYSTLFLAFFVTVIFLFFAKELCNTLYGNPEAGTILIFLSALVPLMYLDGIVDALLKGINEQISVMRYSIIDSSVSIALIIILLPRFGVWGYITMNYISIAVNAFMGVSRFLRVTEIKLSAYNGIIIPLFSAVAATLPVYILCTLTDVSIPLAAEIVHSAILYMILTLIIKRQNQKNSTELYKLKHFLSHSKTFPPFKAWIKR